MSDEKPDSAAAQAGPSPLAEEAGEAGGEGHLFHGVGALGLSRGEPHRPRHLQVLSARNGGLLVDERFFHKGHGHRGPDKDTILLATLFQLISFKNVLGHDQQVNHVFDACYCR